MSRRYLSKFDILSNISSFLLRMIRLLTVIALFSHWNACIQFLLPAAQDFPSRCWPLEAEILADSAFQQYSWSLFRALSQMLCIGYGSPGTAPLLAWEAWMVIISMVFGAVLFAILVGIITTMLVQLDEVNARHR